MQTIFDQACHAVCHCRVIELLSDRNDLLFKDYYYCIKAAHIRALPVTKLLEFC